MFLLLGDCSMIDYLCKQIYVGSLSLELIIATVHNIVTQGHYHVNLFQSFSVVKRQNSYVKKS
jgi:hypothetical protein